MKLDRFLGRGAFGAVFGGTIVDRVGVQLPSVVKSLYAIDNYKLYKFISKLIYNYYNYNLSIWSFQWSESVIVRNQLSASE